jgi:hypothetical protein
MKEAAIETKLRALAAQWGAEAFIFAEHKQRGPVVLKVCVCVCGCVWGGGGRVPQWRFSARAGPAPLCFRRQQRARSCIFLLHPLSA